MTAPAQSRTISIAHILGLEAVVRVQNPAIKRTTGPNPRWFIRPWVDRIGETGELKRCKERIYLGRCDEVQKREAITKRNEVMGTINRSQYVVQAQVNFSDFLDQYLREYVRKPEVLASTTQSKYETHIKNHIRPALGALAMAEVTTKRIDAMLAEKAKDGMAWSTRTDLRNILCGVFTQARKWGYWRDVNPAMDATVGRKREARPRRKLTIEETRKLLAALPDDVRLICETALYCTLRISEVLGLQWKHVDFTSGQIHVRQRFARGDLDTVKSERANRDVAMGALAADLAAMYTADTREDAFVFSVLTHRNEKQPRVSRDDRDINQHFLRPAAKAQGVYYLGFGFHAFRREAVTEHSRSMGPAQAQRMAGHSKADMTLHYTQADQEAQDASVRALQERVRGKVVPIAKGA